MLRIAAGFPRDHWLSDGHRYKGTGQANGNSLLRADLEQGKNGGTDLAEYVGVSAPVHAVDAWSLLGRSIHCLLRGDPYNAVHFAYYSELRAALALLASQGIGVFNSTHAVVTADGQCVLVKAVDTDGKRIGNHQWIWLVFRWWIKQPRAVELLRDIIKPSEEVLRTWLESASKARFALDEVGPTWLEEWGIDIGRYFADRDARNAASYWPNTTNSWEILDHAEKWRAVIDMWQALEPTSGSRFMELDRHLLRIVLKRGYYGAWDEDEESPDGREGFSNEVRTMLGNLGKGGGESDLWHDFLVGSGGEPVAMRMASGKSAIGVPEQVLEVIGRAIMLLRVATGASASLLEEAGIGRQDVDFWIQSIGTTRGLWEEQTPPEDLVDLWGEVEFGLQQIRGRLDDPAPSVLELWALETKAIAVLGECERVALWGLAL